MSASGSRAVAALLAAATAATAALCARPVFAALPTVPTPAPEATTSAVGAGGLLQAGFGMAMVLGLIFLCAWAVRRLGLQRFGSGSVVKVVSSAMVGQRERVVVVEVGGTWLVLGVTGSQVNTLHTLPAQAVVPTPSPAGAFSATTRPIDLFAQKLRESLTGKARPNT
jgi:flagellar protein FliO/FliZ